MTCRKYSLSWIFLVVRAKRHASVLQGSFLSINGNTYSLLIFMNDYSISTTTHLTWLQAFLRGLPFSKQHCLIFATEATPRSTCSWVSNNAHDCYRRTPSRRLVASSAIGINICQHHTCHGWGSSARQPAPKMQRFYHMLH